MAGWSFCWVMEYRTCGASKFMLALKPRATAAQ